MSIQVGRMPSAIDDLHAGKIIILVDDIDRENEGNLSEPLKKTPPQIINFISTNSKRHKNKMARA
ncbi:MAG: 3,4-dihydroxy-2-butanone-4-phosphate synthase [Sedimentisphaerales bacterium]|nr:3,4-dihydroxy-2-butanone-4-phosphate synthase [Sedimentisphaerales bacterium]